MGNVCGGGPKHQKDHKPDSTLDPSFLKQFKLDLGQFNFHKKHKFDQDYRIGKQLGKGAFGLVRACEHKVSNQKYAVKILSKAQMNADNVKEFQNEITMMSKVMDPSCIRIYATYECENRYYIVTDLYKGGDLFDGIMNKGQFSEFDTIATIR